jgi:hypothetical protein
VDNETYLQISYVIMGLGSVLWGLLTWAWLRRRFIAFCDAEPRSRIVPLVRRLFLPGIVTPAMLGFLSVSYFSCDVDTYNEVIANRGYLVDISFSQAQASIRFTVAAIFVWCLIVSGIILTSGK